MKKKKIYVYAISKNEEKFVSRWVESMKEADEIIVLENGFVKGCGTHAELLKKCKVYKEIALSQLSKEELENE